MLKKRGYIGIYFLVIVNLITTLHSDESCSKPPVLNDLTIREPSFYSDYWTTGAGLVLNDRELNTAWYRAVFNGRQYLMSDSQNQPATTSCNTLYPIYLKDKHPSLAELSETPISKAACVLDFDESCSIEVDVMIKKCDKEIQYYLKSTLIYSAYCFNAGGIVYDTEVPAPTNVNLGSIHAVPELRFKRSVARSKRFDFNYSPYIQFRCTFSNSSDHFYNVQWKVAGKTIASLGPSKNIDDLCLHEEKFRDVPLGYMVQCSVTVSAAMFGHQTEPEYSDNFYAGVKIYDATVYVSKGRSKTISMSSTLPIGCKHLDTAYIACKGELRISNAGPHECLQETINNIVSTDYSKCTEYIKTLHKDATWDPNKRFNFKIVTSDMNYEDKTNFDLKLKFSGDMKHEFWKDKVLPDVRVVVVDIEEYKKKVCYSHIDPHMRTADGYYYEQQQEGDFILYYNDKYNIEVQETTKSCGSYATCACGVSVRAGKDVFIINRCGTINFLGFSQCDDGGILQVVEKSSDEYTIFTPIGTKITIKLRRNPHINIDIQMAPKDLKNVRGLCGMFDGDRTNDLVHSDGKSSPLGNSWSHHKEFANSWRVPREEVYSRKKRDLESWANRNGRYCVCLKDEKSKGSAEAVCSNTQYLDCQMKKSITNIKCFIHKYRKKRSLAAHEKEMNRLFGLMEPVNEHNVKKRQTREKISEEQAKQTCSKMISESLAFTSYKNMTASESPDIVINQCVFDLMATQDKEFAEVHKDSVNTIVKGMMNEVPTYVETNKQEVQVFLKNSCFSNCSDRGNCSEDGECICDQYYHGAICNIDERIPPVVMDIEGGGVCDIGEGDECRCFYLRGDNFLKSMKCKIATSEISISGDITNVTMDTVEGSVEDVFTGVCCIPEEKGHTEDMFLREHDISISNDGVHYGENNTMYVFDSACQKLDSLSTGRPSFILKSGFCFIRQACIEDTYAFVSNNDTCLSCNTSVSVNEWTETDMEICIPTTTTSTTKTTKACITVTESVPENTTNSMANMSMGTNEVNDTTEPTMNITTQVEVTAEPSVNLTTQLEVTIEPSMNLTTQVEVTTEHTLNLTTQVDVTTESSMNLTTQTQLSETTSTKPSPRKRCRVKAFLRLKARYDRLSLRNKKRKSKIKRLTKRINRLKKVLEPFQNKGKRRNVQSPTKTTKKTAINHSTVTGRKTANDH